MRLDDWDRELDDLFAAARREDSAAAPDFDRLWRRAVAGAAPPRRRPQWTLRLALAAAAVAVVAAAGVFLRPDRRPAAVAEPDLAAVAALSRWRAPTDFLLATPGRELLTGLPRLGTGAIPSSGIAGESRAPTPTPASEVL